MKKLFGTKPKSGKGSSRDFAEEGLKPQIPTPLYQKLATHGNHILQAPIGVGQPPALALAQGGLAPPPPPLPRSAAGADDERWEVVPTPLPSAATAPAGVPHDHLPNPHSPPSSALPPPSSGIPAQALSQQGQGQGQPIATVTPPSRASSFGSLQAQAQAPLPSAQHHPSVGVLPPRSGSPMSTASGTTNKLIKHRDRERERERSERDAYAQSLTQSQGGDGKDKKKKKPSQPTAPVALGILRALDPPRAESAALSRQISEERATRTVSESGHGFASTYTGSVAGDRDPRGLYHRELSAGSGYGYREPVAPPPQEKEKEKKRGFWSRDKDKDKDKDRALDKEREKALERERAERERAERERPVEIPSQRERQDNYNINPNPQEQERGREPRREESGAELTRMIGYLTATASEDWALVLDVCDRASANETNAKEAVRALRREFKYGEPAAQLSAARLWAIMLRNSSDIFITQSTTRKFLDTLEDLLSSSRTSPVVRERLLEVVAAAAYASGSKKGHDRDGFKGLWRRVKPFDKPDEGVPFDTDDAMFHPPAPISGRLSSGYDIPSVAYQEPTPPALESAPLTPAAPNPIKERSKRRSPPHSNRIIPPEEDMRRLFQECKIGQGNASLLSQALVTAKPEDLKRQDIIREFYVKCQASQELIYAQIPWATSSAERAVANKERDREQRERERGSKNHHHTRNRTLSNDLHRAAKDRSDSSPDGPDEGTQEERLLAALLAANAELVEVLRQYEDLERVAMERKAEDRSRKETRMDPRQRERIAAEPGTGDSWGAVGGGAPTTTTSTAASRTPSPPSPQLSYQSHQQQQQPNHYQQQQQQLSNNNPYQQQRHQHSYQQQQPQAPPPPAQLAQPQPRSKQFGLPESYPYSSDANFLAANGGVNPSTNSVNNPNPSANPLPNPNLAPPPAAPHGPRSPAQAPSTHSRASSPATPSLGGHGHAAGGYGAVNGYTAGYAQGQGQGQGQGNGYGSQHGHGAGAVYGQSYGQGQGYGDAASHSDDDSEYEVPIKPSAKALGKRKVVEPEVSTGPQFDPDDIYAPLPDNQFYGSDKQDPESYSDDDAYSDSHQRPGWSRQPTHFVYDAVAERTKELQMQLRQQELEEQERAERERLQRRREGPIANGTH